jgi:hypothetical protein
MGRRRFQRWVGCNLEFRHIKKVNCGFLFEQSYFTDLGANFDRLDLYRAVQVKQNQISRLIIERISHLLSV